MGLDMYLRAEEYVSGYDFNAALKPVADTGLQAVTYGLASIGMKAAQVVSTPAPENVTRYRRLLEETGLTTMADPNTPSLTISVTVAYWRKVNAVHSWFVENVQEGRDECQQSYVRRDQLVELRAVVLTAIDAYRGGDMQAAEEVLPTRSGFFFGSTAMDDGYLADLDDTVGQLDRVLNHPRSEQVDYYYQASW